jgi:hypothetical protein
LPQQAAPGKSGARNARFGGIVALMNELYWITGTVTAAQRTNQFMILIKADGETEAVGGSIKALSPEWSTVEIGSIRIIDPSLSYRAEETLREAIEIAQDQGFFLFLCDQPVSS